MAAPFGCFFEPILRRKKPCENSKRHLRRSKNIYGRRGRVRGSPGKNDMRQPGGGNHFIELDWGEDGSLSLLVHTGSRHLGKAVCEACPWVPEGAGAGGSLLHELSGGGRKESLYGSTGNHPDKRAGRHDSGDRTGQ